MSEYGVKIKNYQAGSVFAVMNGVRGNYDYREAMLTNSLFADFLKENGLKIYKNSSTRDVIGVEFKYGSRSYEEERKRIEDNIRNIKKDTSISEQERFKKLNYFGNLLSAAEENRHLFQKKTADEIREYFYEHGLDITYNDRDAKKTTIHYKMLYRSAGKAKKGTCMFIAERLYKRARKFLYMNLKLPKYNAPIVEIGAYSSLVASTIVDRIQIDPHNVLILDDVDSIFHTNVISVETDDAKQCHAVYKDDYEVKNTLFDGQALIDLSIFPEWADGFILLRQHFTKAAAFATDIQGFFRDYFGDNYEDAFITDCFGYRHRARNIKVITTTNAMKWMKFGVKYLDWCDIVLQNGGMWGIVKTTHESKLGNVQQMSYQMINTLSNSIMPNVVSKSIHYIETLKSDINVYIDYLKRNSTFANDYAVLVSLYEQNPAIEQSDYWRDRKVQIISQYMKKVRHGKIIQNADNCTIVGSPYAMLLHSVGEDVKNDPTFSVEDGCIQCHSERFDYDKYLAAFRSPHNSENNILHLHNVDHPYFKKYFRLGKLCIATNMQHTDFQPRANGSDQDGDTIFATDHEDIVRHAAMCYRDYPTVVNNIPMEKNNYDNTMKNFAMIDNGLAHAQMAIGESSNLAQLCLTYKHSYNKRLYKDCACILAVIAQCSIDSAKRRFDIDISSEIKRIKAKINVKNNGYPMFWKAIHPEIDFKHINKSLVCPMDYIYKIDARRFRASTETIPISDFFVKHKLDMNKKTSRKVDELICKYSLHLYDFVSDRSDEDNVLLLMSDFDDLIEDIRKTSISGKYVGLFSWLIDRCFKMTPQLVGREIKSKIDRNRPLLLKVLYESNPKALLSCFTQQSNEIEKTA